MARFVVRPVREKDFDAFLELARKTGGELTNIPGDPEVVRWRIDDSILSFDPRVHKAGSHRYLFVLEELESGRLGGTCGIISKVGGFHPWYCYDFRKENVTYHPLGIDHQVDVLSPNINYNGPSEICCLFILPEFRKGGWGRLLSLSRFHFMAEFSRRFDRDVIAELRGVTDASKNSPFWEAVGRHFFEMDFRRADCLSGLEDKAFIESLMPRYPVYADLLPSAAREVIGRPHPDAEPALALLLGQGFAYRGQVDIFDAGPVVGAVLDQIRTIRERKKYRVNRVIEGIVENALFLLSNGRLDFRSCIGPIREDDNEGVEIDSATAAMLELGEGDFVSFSPLRRAYSPGRTGTQWVDRTIRKESTG